MNSILIVDDEDSMRDLLTIMLKKEGYEPFDVPSGEEAINVLNERSFDLVITDLKMQKVTGIDVLKEVMLKAPATQTIVMTAYASTETAVEAMKAGAYDYISKPFKIDEVKVIIQKALEKKRLREENIYLKQELHERYQFCNIIGKSEEMGKVFEMISKVANSGSTVLITGESGTGKELVAKAIHFNSQRKDKPFMSVNCGALPEQLLESELFGHKKGAFTSADFDKKGLMEVADEGSFFLDEIGEAPLSIQVKLLRVLQEREFKPVGGIKNIQVNIRIVAATNGDLAELVRQGLFREDLFYRLNVIPIAMPPLRERKKDIPLLVDHFIKKFNEVTQKNILGVEQEALTALEQYDWPGNVRELENAIERGMVLESTDIIQVHNLPDTVLAAALIAEGGSRGERYETIPDKGIDLEKILGNFERDLVEKALKKTKGSLSKAADLLSVNLRSLRYRVQKHDIKKVKK